MAKQKLTWDQFADLLNREVERGIIDGSSLLSSIMRNLLPPQITDVRGKVRLVVERDGEDVAVTTYMTDVAKEAYKKRLI